MEKPMAQGQGKSNRVAVAGDHPGGWGRRVRRTIGTISLTATNFLPKAKVEATAAQWLAGIPEPKDEDEFIRLLGNAAVMAMAVALFAPSLSGQTAIVRFCLQHKAAGPDETAAI